MPSIQLTDKQFKKLLDLAYLGNWMVNSFKIDDQAEDYNNIEQLLLSKASEFNQQESVIYDEEEKEYFTNQKYEKEMDQYIDQYNNYTFWDELASQLAIRDMIKQVAPVKELEAKHWTIKYNIEQTYVHEFAENGLENVIVEMKKST